MINNKKLVVDTFAEVYGLIEPWVDKSFVDFSTVNIEPGSTYMIGRQQLLKNLQKIKDMAWSDQFVMIFNNSAEGSWTLEMQVKQYGIEELILAKKILLISGAKVSSRYPCLSYEHFLCSILDYEENLQAQQQTDNIFLKHSKPYKFLFLNGRARPHRKYLYERLLRTGALDQALWSMLDAKPKFVPQFQLNEDDINIMDTPSPIQRLPDQYEVDRYRQPKLAPVVPGLSNIKKELFHTEWGEIYLEPAPYVDTYFSLVTETVCYESVYSFRTEKMAKPLAMGHPFVVASTPGFYQDLHRLGFQTFGHVIDETFDQIENAQDRMNRIVDIVTDLCKQDLASFLAECYNTCKYNQQRLAELRDQVRQEFPDKFFQFLKENTTL